MVAALKAREAGAQKVGILDLDAHYGNGTENIIGCIGARDWVHHYTYGNDSVSRATSNEWVARLDSIVEGFRGCDVVIYQAGADPHVNDPLGGDLTTKQMEKRDHIVFDTLKRLDIPVAWNLAGGYQPNLQNVIDIHVNTMRKCLLVYGD